MLNFLLWAAFILFILAILILDLAVFNRKAHAIKIREAFLLSAIWIVLALLFNLGLYFIQGPERGVQFMTGYLIEKSLSLDNLFVFLLTFSYFRVPLIYQHKVLTFGIFSAMIMRLVFIGLGVTLIQRFHWIIYLFGAFLIMTGIKMAIKKEIHPERNRILRYVRRFIPITEDYEDGKFFIKRNASLYATPLFIVLLIIEISDLIFAIDSIPAIFAITIDPFIVYTSNVFAILGLRSLYFALARIIPLFYYLHYGLSLILVFVGVKMLASNIYEILPGVALGVVGSILLIVVIASIIRSAKEARSLLKEVGKMRKKVEEALKSIRPTLLADGGDVELISVDENGMVTVRLKGACGCCPMSQMTLKTGIGRILKELVPGVKEVVSI